MKRRELIVGVGAVTVVSFAAAAQTSSTPVIGFLGSEAEEKGSERFQAFHKALAEAGFAEGRNIAIEYRWAQGRIDRYPALAEELVRHRVSVIASMGGVPAARAAKNATGTIPIVTQGAFDPVEAGIVASQSRPGGNITGVTNLGISLGPKRLELMQQLLPDAKMFGLLVNPTHPLTPPQVVEVEAAARTLGVQLHIAHASAVQDLDKAFASLAPQGVKALVVSAGQPFTTRSVELAELAARYKMPAVAESHEFVAAGGLMTYGGKREDAYTLVGQYVARILKGEKPGDLPVLRSTKVELMVNMKAAKELGLTIPITLLGRADEVIE